MSFIHYKFKSSKDYDTLTFDGLHISLGDLKKAILQHKKQAKSIDFDLQIVNAQSREVYKDDEELIPKNTSVVVARIPVGRQSTSKPWEPSNRDAAYVGSQPNKGMESAITLERLKQTPDLVNAFASEEDKIKAMMTQSTKDYDQTNYMKPRFPSTAIRPGYVCYKCNKPGHHIANCTAKTENDAPVRMRRAHGIPANFLTPVSAPDSNLPGVLMTIRGQLAVPTIDAKAYLAGKKEKPPFVSSKDDDKPVADDRSVPRELLCLICDQISTDAVVIACCGNSYCDECIREALLSSESHTCPTCGKSGQSPDQLIANRFLRTAIQNYKNETGYANVTSSKQPAVVPQQPAALTQQPAVLPQQSAAVPQQQAPPTSIAYNNTPPQIHHDPPTSHSHTEEPPVSLPTAARAVGGSPYQQDVGTPPQSSHKAEPPKHQPIQQLTDIPVMLSPPRSMPPRSAFNPSSSSLPYDNNHQATPPSDSLSFNNSQAIVRVTTSTRRYPTPDVPRQDGFEGNNFYNRPGQRPLDGPPGSRPHEGQGPALPQDPPPMHLMNLPVHSGGSMPPRPDFPRMDGPGARPPPPIGLPPHLPNMGPIMSMPPHIPPPVRGPPMARPPMGMLNGPPPPIMNRPLGPHPLVPEPMNRPMMNRNDGRMPNYPPPHGGPPPPPGTGPMPSAPPGMGGPRFPPPPAAHIPPLTEEQFYKEKDRLRRVSEKKVKPDPMDDFAKELMKPRVRPVRPISKSHSRSRSRSVSRPRKFSRSRSRSRSKGRLRTRSHSRSHSRTRKLSFSRSRSQSRSRARSRTRSPRPSRKKSWSRSPRPYKRSRSPLSVSPRPKPHSRSRSPRPPTRGRRSQSPGWRHGGRSPDLPRRRSRSPYYGRRGSPGPSVESGRSRYRRGRSPSPYRSKAYPMPFPHQGPQSMPPGGDYVSDDYRFPDSQDARWAEYFNYYRQYFDHYHDHSTSYSGGPPYSPGHVSHSTRDRWPPMGSRTPPPPTRARSRSGSRSRYHPRDGADRHRDHEKYRERESSRSHKYKEDDHMDYKERDRKPALDERVQSKERKREKEHKKDRKKSKKDKKPKELRGSSSSKVKEKVASSRDSKDLPLPPLRGHSPSDFSSSTDLTETDSDLEEKRVQKKMESCKRTKELVKKKESRDGQRSGEKPGMSNNSQEKSYKVSTQSEADKRPKHYTAAPEVKLKKPSSSDSKEKLDGDAKTPHPNKSSSDAQPESKMQGKLVSKPIEVMGDKMTRTEVPGAVVSQMSLEASGRMKNDKSTITKSNLIHVKPVKDVMIPRTVAVQKKPRSRSNTPTADIKKRSRSRTPSGQGQDKVSVVPVKKMKQVEKPESRLKVKATGSPGIQKQFGGASKAKFEGIYDLEGSDGNLESPVKESVLVAEPPQLSKWERSDPSSEPDEDIDKKKKHMKIEEKKPLPKSVIETAEKVLANKPRQGAVVSSHIHRVTRSPSPSHHQSPPSSKRWRSLQSPEHRSSRQSPEHRSSRQSPEHRSTRPSLERKTSDRRGSRPSPDRKSSRRSPEYRSSRRSPERRSSRQSPEYRSSRRMPEHRNSRQSPKRRSSKQSPEHSGPRASQDPRGSPKRRQVVTSQRSVQVTVSTKESKRSVQGSDDDLSYDLRDKLKGSQRKGFISGSDKRNVVHMDSGELIKKEAKKSSSFERKVSVIDESVFEPDYDETYDSDADPAPGSKGAVSKSCEVVTESSASRLDSDTQPDSDSDSRSDSKSKRSQDESKSKPKKQKSKHKKEKKEKKHKKKSKKKHRDA